LNFVYYGHIQMIANRTKWTVNNFQLIWSGDESTKASFIVPGTPSIFTARWCLHFLWRFSALFHFNYKQISRCDGFDCIR